MSLLRMSNFTQQIITSMKFIASNFFTRGDQLTLGRSKPKWSWQHLTTSLLLVLNNFINKRFTTKSREEISDLSSGQASKPYSKIGIHFMFINCKVISSEAISPILSNSTRKLLWFEITKMLIAVLTIQIYCDIYYYFRHTFVAYILIARRQALKCVHPPPQFL